MQGVFITGTSTDVGKTFIAVLLARQLTAQGVRVIPRKPVESGCLKQDNELIPQDAKALMEAAAYDGLLSDVCPFRFEPPISPVRAAHLANKVLTTEQLVKICFNNSGNGFVLVEGAGGFYSPLAEDGLNADLAMALQLPVILVANDALGCINQVLLSAEAIKIRGLTLAAVILNAIDAERDMNMDNATDLRENLDCPVYTQAHGLNNAALPEELLNSLLPQENTTRRVN